MSHFSLDDTLITRRNATFGGDHVELDISMVVGRNDAALISAFVPGGSIGFHDVRDPIIKCKHCGQFAARYTACKHCGAPVE